MHTALAQVHKTINVRMVNTVYDVLFHPEHYGGIVTYNMLIQRC